MLKIRQLVKVVLLLAQGIFEVLKRANNLEEMEEQYNGPMGLTQKQKF